MLTRGTRPQQLLVTFQFLACQDGIGSTTQLHASLLHARSPDKLSRGPCVIAGVSRRPGGVMDGQSATKSPPPLIDSFRALAGKPHDRACPGDETYLQGCQSGTCPHRTSGCWVFGPFRETTPQTLQPNVARHGEKGTRCRRGFHPAPSNAREKVGHHVGAFPFNSRGMETGLHLHAQEQQAYRYNWGQLVRSMMGTAVEGF